MTVRVSQGGMVLGVKPEPAPARVKQAAMIVAVTPAPSTSPSQVSQAALIVGVRKRGRRTIGITY